MNDDPPQTNKGVIFVVVFTICINATIGVITLAYGLLFHSGELNSALLTAFVGLVTGALGVVGGMLSKTSPSEATKQVAVETKPVVVEKPDEPIKA